MIRRESIDLVWVVLNGVAPIHLAHRVMHRINVPLVCTEWDSPQYFAICSPLSLLPWASLLAKYRWLVQRAARVSVMSETGRRVFRTEYGVDGIPWKHGLREQLWHAGNARCSRKPGLDIGFAGSLYCKREWNALVRALERAAWRVGGKDVRIRFIGRFPRIFARRSERIVEQGAETLERTIEALASMDVAYLPYWLDPKWSYVVKTSFPSKLSAYVAAGLPVFYHGPGASSVSDFLEQYPIGLQSDSLRPNDILRCLERLIEDQDVLDRAAVARRAALENELGYHVMIDRFARLLGTDRNELRPVPATNLQRQ